MTAAIAAVLALDPNGADHKLVCGEFERQYQLGLVATWPREFRVRMVEVLRGGSYRDARRKDFHDHAAEA